MKSVVAFVLTFTACATTSLSQEMHTFDIRSKPTAYLDCRLPAYTQDLMIVRACTQKNGQTYCVFILPIDEQLVETMVRIDDCENGDFTALAYRFRGFEEWKEFKGGTNRAEMGETL